MTHAVKPFDNFSICFIDLNGWVQKDVLLFQFEIYTFNYIKLTITPKCLEQLLVKLLLQIIPLHMFDIRLFKKDIYLIVTLI